ncbi:MAG: tetratricopeptide repeat protein, partial [Sediminispirochaetaceae bacterium]
MLPAADIDEAYTLYNRGRYEAAAAALESLRDRGELEGPDLGLLGMCYLHLDRLEDARQAITLAGRLSPGNYTVLLARGNLLLYQEKYDEAEEVFRRADSFFPGRMETRNGIAAAFAGRAFESLRAGDYEAAAEMAGRAWELQPENLKLLTARIAALRQTDRTEELRSAYRDYLELQPESADAHAGLGLLLYADGLKSDGLKSDGLKGDDLKGDDLTERGRTEQPLT